MSELFWRDDSCTVSVRYTSDGGLEFSGHDARAFGTSGYEYEYVVGVAGGHFHLIRMALGVTADTDVLTAVIAHAGTIMPGGEVGWLRRHGVPHDTSVWSSPPD